MAHEMLIGDGPSEIISWTRPTATAGAQAWNSTTGSPTVYNNINLSWEPSPFRAYAALQLDPADFIAAGVRFAHMVGDVPFTPLIGDVAILNDGSHLIVKYADFLGPDGRPILWIVAFDA